MDSKRGLSVSQCFAEVLCALERIEAVDKGDSLRPSPIQRSNEVKLMSAKVKEAVDTNPLSVLGEALESAVETFGEATTNARASAKVAARKVEQSFSTGVYKAAYGISYGLVFGAVFLTELLPDDNILRRGFQEGAEAALDAAAKKAESFSASRRSGAARKKSAARAGNPAKPSQRRSLPKPRKAEA
jgi:hypothetical protein